jgi:hypothetical protein
MHPTAFSDFHPFLGLRTLLAIGRFKAFLELLIQGLWLG